MATGKGRPYYTRMKRLARPRIVGAGLAPALATFILSPIYRAPGVGWDNFASSIRYKRYKCYKCYK